MVDPQDKTLPQPDTDFGDEIFDPAPIKSGGFGGFNDWMFSMMRPKKKEIKQEPLKSNRIKFPRLESKHATNVESVPLPQTLPPIPEGYEIQSGLLFKKKSLAERVRDQIKFPQIKLLPTVISGLALTVFAVGAYLLYASLPNRPDLILGIILVSLAGNIILNNR